MNRVMALIILVMSCLALTNPATAAPRLYLELTTDKQIYHSGEPIAVALTVVNQNTLPYQAHFASSQIYDVILSDSSGQKIWQWSDGKLFTQAFTQVTFDPYLPKTWLIVIEPSRWARQTLPPGIYRLTPVIESTEIHLETEPHEIEIRK